MRPPSTISAALSHAIRVKVMRPPWTRSPHKVMGSDWRIRELPRQCEYHACYVCRILGHLRDGHTTCSWLPHGESNAQVPPVRAADGHGVEARGREGPDALRVPSMPG